MEKTQTPPERDVKKPMCFVPVDETAKWEFRAMKVRNAFREMGFTVRRVFVDEVFKAYPEYNTIQGFKTMEAFWSLRYFGPELIEKLEVLADNLKEEA